MIHERATTKVFISWSGDLSKEVASLLNEWLQSVAPFVTTYLSVDNLHLGERWSLNLSKELQETEFGIFCMTADNINSAWINYEAGVLSQDIDGSHLIPLLINVSNEALQVSPLAQFQTTALDKNGVLRLVLTLYRKFNSTTPEARVRQIFEKWWPDLQEALQKMDSSKLVTEISPFDKLQADFHEVKQQFKLQQAQMNEMLEYLTAEVSLKAERPKVSIESLEGLWFDNSNNTQYFFRMIDGKLYIPYLYLGFLDYRSHYYNVRLINDVLYGRFQWFDQKISGYLYLKLIDDRHAEGGWWYSRSVNPNIRLEELSDETPNMQNLSWTKEDNQGDEPSWVTDYVQEKLYLEYQF